MQLLQLTTAQSTAYNFAQGAFSRALGANEALRAFQGIGGLIRRQDFLSLYRYVGGITKAGYDVAAVRKDYYPAYDKLPDSLTNIRRDYSFDVRIGWSGDVDESGKPIYNYVTVTSDRKLTVGEIEAEADRYIEEAEPENMSGSDMEYLEPVVVRARKRGVFEGV